eukprot:TRINITY_DN9997_c0_g1_i1.p1 TRINITY_DN9997_c0_g1~~TRINITY_DN9997_c0_g1_i1.p1  ORF type:complete len:135 (-),score=28.96 TRINITY_DN9997_c0_g1_i1:285-635(-)
MQEETDKKTNKPWTSKWKREDSEFFESLANTLGLKDKEDWYKIKKEDVIKHGGEKILQKEFGGSVKMALETIYPNHKWLPWNFEDVAPKGMWNNPVIQREMMDYLAKQLKITKLED